MLETRAPARVLRRICRALTMMMYGATDNQTPLILQAMAELRKGIGAREECTILTNTLEAVDEMAEHRRLHRRRSEAGGFVTVDDGIFMEMVALYDEINYQMRNGIPALLVLRRVQRTRADNRSVEEPASTVAIVISGQPELLKIWHDLGDAQPEPMVETK